MSDAFGAKYYIGTALLFIALFSSLLAISLNYTKAFRVKNTIVSYIEKNDGCLHDGSLETKINNYVAEMDYYVNNVNPGSSVIQTVDTYHVVSDGFRYARGYCIYHYTSSDESVFSHKGDYYKVVTYIQITFPFFGLDVKVPVTGETRLVSERHGQC